MLQYFFIKFFCFLISLIFLKIDGFRKGLFYKKLIEFENLQNKGEKLDEKQQDYLDAFISLYNNVVLKDLVSEGLWYLLAGGLVITMTQNAISEMECEKNTEEMKQEYEEGGGWKKSKMENIKE